MVVLAGHASEGLLAAVGRSMNVVLVRPDDSAEVEADFSVEVEDVDAVHAAMTGAGAEIVYALRDEPWGVRRFFVRDPNGRVVNVVSHR